ATSLLLKILTIQQISSPLKNFFGCYRQALDAHTQGVMYRVGNRRCHCDDRGFSDTHAVVGSAAHRRFDDDLAQFGNVTNRWNLVIAKMQRRHFAVSEKY